MKKAILFYLCFFIYSSYSIAFAQIPQTLGWHQLSSTTVRPLCASPEPPGNTGCDSITSTWSGGIMDTKRNRLIFFGGGHNDYSGNEIIALNLGDGTTNPTTTRIQNASTSISTCSALYPDGKQAAQHTYNQITYDAERDAMFNLNTTPYCDKPFTNFTIWLDFSTMSWSQKTSTNAPGGDFAHACAYDPRHKLHYCHSTSQLKSYNFATNTWTTRGASVSAFNYKTGMIDPVRKRYIYSGQEFSGNVRWYDISSSSATGLSQTSVATNCSWPSQRGGLEYDPVQDVAVAWNGGNSVEIMNLTTYQCTTETWSGGPTATPNGTFGRFRYSPSLNLYVVCNDIDANCYALRRTIVKTILPTVDDEKNTYRSWGWTISASTDTFNTTDPLGSFTVTAGNTDIHGQTEGDDAWTYHHQFRRSGNSIFQNRATAWFNYFKNGTSNGYRDCSPSDNDFCEDRGFGLDHMYGVGLIDYYEATGDSAALTEINNLGTELNAMYQSGTPFGCLLTNGCLHFGMRGPGRHLLFATRWAELTGNATAIALRDNIINKFLSSGQWNATFGMYFMGETNTEDADSLDDPTAYDNGFRVMAPWHIGIVAEAFHHVIRTTANATIKARLIAMANFVNTYGIDPTYEYTGSRFGVNINTGVGVYSHSYPSGVSTGADPAMTTSLVGVLVYGYKYTGNTALLDRARVFFNRGTKGQYQTLNRTCADTSVCHFQDTVFSTGDGNRYLDYNKGELQYTYRIFENGGAPTVLASGGGSPQQFNQSLSDALGLGEVPNRFIPRGTLKRMFQRKLL